VEGTFKASAEAARLSSATLFNGSSIPVTARFSDGSGMPGVPDGSPAMPRGIAMKYHLPGGADTDMVTNSFKFFPVVEGQDRPIQSRRFGERRYTRWAAGRFTRHGAEADVAAASRECLRSRSGLRTYS
jgi:Catalase